MKKPKRQMLVKSLFNEDYTAVCDMKTGEIMYHKEQLEAAMREKNGPYYQLWMTNYDTMESKSIGEPTFESKAKEDMKWWKSKLKNSRTHQNTELYVKYLFKHAIQNRQTEAPTLFGPEG